MDDVGDVSRPHRLHRVDLALRSKKMKHTLHTVFAAYDYLLAHCDGSDNGLRLQPAKCRVLWPHANNPPPAIVAACEQRHLKLERGSMELLGARVGVLEQRDREWAVQQTRDHKQLFDSLAHPTMPALHATHMLRSSAIPSMGYISRTTPADIARDGLQQFDDEAERVLCHKLKLPATLTT